MTTTSHNANARQLLAQLKEEGCALPPLMAQLLEPDHGPAQPVAIGTRQALEGWAAEHGYSSRQREILQRALMKMVRTMSYLTALASDEAWRHDLQGAPVEPVDAVHRLAASIELLSRTGAPAARAEASEPLKPVQAVMPPAAPQTTHPAPLRPKERNTVVVQRMRKLGAEEMAKRAAALRNAPG